MFIKVTFGDKPLLSPDAIRKIAQKAAELFGQKYPSFPPPKMTVNGFIFGAEARNCETHFAHLSGIIVGLTDNFRSKIAGITITESQSEN
jgi:hypothetical protein